MLRPLLFTVLFAVGGRISVAQETNAARMGALAVACAAEAVGSLDAVALDGPDRLPFLRSAIVSAWQASGRTVYVADSTGSRAVVRLRVEQAGVRYEPADGRVRRTIDLALRMARMEADGRILLDTACRRSVDDVVPRDLLSTLEDPAFPETRGDPPPAGWFRRYLQPAMIVTATAIGTFLFFSLRSSRTEDG